MNERFENFRRKVALVMAIVMIISCLPLTALAEITRDVFGGAQLLSIAVDPDEDNTPYITYTFSDPEHKDVSYAEYKQIVKNGEVLYAPPSPELEGYKFLGWSADGSSMHKFGVQEVAASADVELKAVYEQVYYVFFMDKEDRVYRTKEGTANTSINTTDVLINVDAEEAHTGWLLEKDAEETVSSVTLTDGNITLYPKVESGHWLTFDSQEGSYVAPVFVKPTQNTVAPAAPVRAGYTFKHWSTTVNGDSAYTFGGTLSEATTLYAVWTANTETEYTVAYWQENANWQNPFEGEPQDTEPYSYVRSETRKGTTGQYTNVSAENVTVPADFELVTAGEYAVANKVINGDGSTVINVYFNRKQYTIYFYSNKCGKEEHTHFNNGTSWDCYYGSYLTCNKEEHTHSDSCNEEIDSITAKVGASIGTQWPSTTKYGTRWAISSGSTTCQNFIDVMPSGGEDFYLPEDGNDITRYVYYYVQTLPGETAVKTHWDISFKLDHTDTSKRGGNGTITVNEDCYPMAGFTFKGAYTRSSDWEDWDWRTSNIEGRRYNGAEFYYTRNTYKVRFRSEGAEIHTVDKLFEASLSDVSYTPPANLAPSSAVDPNTKKVFAGWYWDANCSDNKLVGSKNEQGVYTFSMTGNMPAYDLTVYAKWVEPVHNATVYVTMEGTDTPTKYTINHGDTIDEDDLPAPNIPDGYVWRGWCKDPNNYEPFNFNTKITTDITLYPYYTNASSFVVNYDTTTNGGSGEVTDSKKYAEKAHADIQSAENVKAPDGKVFLYWCKNQDGTGDQYYPGNKLEIGTANVTLYAIYGEKATTTELTYYANFGDNESYKHTITVDDVEGSTLLNNNAITVKSYAETGLDKREGWEFSHWNTQADGNGTSFKEGASARVNTNGENALYAIWTEKTVTINYAVVGGTNGGGTVSPTSEKIMAQTVNTAAGSTPTANENYKFVGWYSDAAGEDEDLISDQADWKPTKSENALWKDGTTFYAKFELDVAPYTVKFYKDSVSETNHVDDADVTYGPAVIGTKLGDLEYSTTIGSAVSDKVAGYKTTGAVDPDHSLTEIQASGNVISVVLSKLDNLEYKIEFCWAGTKELIQDKTPVVVDKQTFDDTISISVDEGVVSVGGEPHEIPGYTFAYSDPQDSIKIKADNNSNVIKLYYYKNVILTAKSDENKVYDGSQQQVVGYTVAESINGVAENINGLVFDDDITAAVVGTDANSYPVNFTGEPIGKKDSTGNYLVINAIPGVMKINPKPVTLVSATLTKVYDGTALTNADAAELGVEVEDNGIFTESGWVGTDGVSYTFTGSITRVGSTDNSFTYTALEGTNLDNYSIDEQYGKLIITGSDYPMFFVEVVANSDEATYDGTTHSIPANELYKYIKVGDGDEQAVVDNNLKFVFENGAEYTIEGLTVSGASRKDVGSTPNVITIDKIVVRDEDGVDVTDLFFVETTNGSLTITKRAVTLKSADLSKEYDGTALVNGETALATETGFVEGEGATYTFTGSQTVVGNSANAFTYTLNDNTKAGNYEIDTKFGTLTVSKITTEIVITAESDSKMYDGSALTNDGYTYTEGILAEGDELTAVVEGTITDVGTAVNVVTSYKVMRGEDDVTANYTFGESVNGTLEVTKRAVTLTSATDSKTYDGQPLTNSEVTVSGDGFVSGEGATYDVTGSQTLVGSSENTFTYTLNEGTKDGNYEIEVVFGTLVVTDENVPDDLVITKTADEGPYELNDKVTFTIEVTNIYATAKDIVIIDDVEGVELAESAFENVAPGATISTMATYTIKEKDILNGSFTNTAKVKFEYEYQASAKVLTKAPNGHLKITKETTSEPANGESYALGETITYEITVTNDGNLTITNITVTDELTDDEWTIESLAPGANQTFETKPYTVTEADILAGTVVNVATGKGTSPDPNEPDVPVTPGEKEDPTDDPNGHLTITKETTSTPANGKTYALGEEITYEITVTNDGNLTITNITVTDELTDDEWTIESLAPGANQTFETKPYTVTEADILAGTVVNVATGKGTSPDPDEPDVPVTPGEKEEPTDDPNGHLTIEKVTTSTPANGKTYALGETISYAITVLNDGNLTITDIMVSDELTGDEWTIASLAPKESKEFEASYTVTEADILAGEVVNVATAKGTSPDPDEPDVPVEPGVDPEPTDPKNGHLTITKETTSTPANGKTYALGETISYAITVLNDGNLTITDIVVTDKLTGNIGDAAWTIDVLKPGESKTFETSYVVTETEIIAGKVVNEATASGTSPDPDKPDATVEPGKKEDPTDPPAPSFELTKEIINSDGKPYGFEDEIKYRVTFTNTGNVSLTETVIDDVAGAGNELKSFDLETVAPGETVTIEYTYIVKDGDLRPTYKADGVTVEDHYVTNTATVNTKPANDLKITMTDSKSVTHEVEQWYTAIFVDTRTNEVVEFINVPYGGSIELPDAPEHRGYNFLGWRYPILNNITFNQMIYAYYERDTETIFDARIPLAGGYISNVGDCFD